MAERRPPSNEVLLQQLREGKLKFELRQAAPSSSPSPEPEPLPLGFFARIRGSPINGTSGAMRKAQRFSVRTVTGDGRCLFRALVKGMSYNRGFEVNSKQEKDGADKLRMAVKEAICDSEKDRLQFKEALVAITVEESLKRYCQRIRRPDFWGGESELLVLSKLCCQPIIVYIPAHEFPGGGAQYGSGYYIPIAEYGLEFGNKQQPTQQAVRLLYSGKSHYDLLV